MSSVVFVGVAVSEAGVFGVAATVGVAVAVLSDTGGFFSSVLMDAVSYKLKHACTHMLHTYYTPHTRVHMHAHTHTNIQRTDTCC